MEMDWGTAIIGSISTILCILPFAAMYYNRITKEKKMLQSLNELAQQRNSKISQYEFCGDIVIGIDINKNFVYFWKQNNGNTISKVIELSNVISCQIVRKTKNTTKSLNIHPITESLELGFTTLSNDKADIKLVIYDENVNLKLSGELQFIEKWAKLISNHLKSNI